MRRRAAARTRFFFFYFLVFLTCSFTKHGSDGLGATRSRAWCEQMKNVMVLLTLNRNHSGFQRRKPPSANADMRRRVRVQGSALLGSGEARAGLRVAALSEPSPRRMPTCVGGH